MVVSFLAVSDRADETGPAGGRICLGTMVARRN